MAWCLVKQRIRLHGVVLSQTQTTLTLPFKSGNYFLLEDMDDVVLLSVPTLATKKFLNVLYQWILNRNRGSSPGNGWEFFSSPPRPDRLWGLPSLLWVPDLPLGAKRPGCEADHSLPSTAGVLYLHSPNMPTWRGAQSKHRDNFIFHQTEIKSNVIWSMTV
jgi:hypothetical protein